MDYSDTESTLLEAYSTPSQPSSQATSSAPPSVPADRTRNRSLRKGVIPAKNSTQSQLPFSRPTQRDSDNYRLLENIPISIERQLEAAALIDKEEEKLEDTSLDLSPYTPGPGSSISQASSTVSRKRRREKISNIYTHCTLQNREDGPYFACNHCTKTYKQNGGTANMSKHLRERHQWDPSASGVARKRQLDGTAVDTAIRRGAEANSATEQLRREALLASGLNHATLEYLYLQWIITCDLPFNQVTHTPFRAFLEYISPPANKMLPYAASTIREHSFKLFAEGKRRLRHIMLTAISDIHITCDMWTSPNHLGILAVVAHFTAESLERREITLAMKELQGVHSGENQATILLQVLGDYGIIGRLGYFVMDNAHSNDTLINIISEALLKNHGVDYNPHQHRLRCLGHVINLSAQAFLFGKAVDDYEYPGETYVSPSDEQLKQWRRLGPLGKLHNINIYIMGSTQRVQHFKAISGGVMPHRDNATRWNSWYEMLDWAIRKTKPAILQLTSEEEALSKDQLSADDWKTLLQIRDFLLCFYEATKETEGRQATLDNVLPSMDFILGCFEDASDEFADHDILRESVQSGYTKMLKYWNRTERSPVYMAAIVLNPCVKWTYFDKWNAEWRPTMKDDLRTFWETIYRSSTGLPVRPSAAPEPTSSFRKWKANMGGGAQTTGDELEQYLSEPLLMGSNDISAIEWWLLLEQRQRLPLLSKMAIDIYSIPPMSSEPERVFSGTKHTITDQRCSLKIETIELLECLKSWFRIGIFTQEDLHSVIAMQERDRDYIGDGEGEL